MVEHLPSMPKVMSSIPSSTEAGEEGASKTVGAAGLEWLWGNVIYGGMTSNPRLRLAEGRGVRRAHLAAHISSRWSEPLPSLKYQLNTTNEVKRRGLLLVEVLPRP